MSTPAKTRKFDKLTFPPNMYMTIDTNIINVIKAKNSL